jgi:zinc transport system substrate-binding protein
MNAEASFRIKSAALPFVLIALAFATPIEASSAKIRVLTSFLPVYCFTANVAGDSAEVENLLRGGAGPHDYQLSVRDRERIRAADLVVLNGLGIDSWIEPVLRSANAKTVFLSSGLSNDLARVEGSPLNAHIWLDPVLAMSCVSNIARALIEVDPGHQEAYSRNTSNYLARLKALNEEFRAGLEPCQGAKIVTFHDSFPYLMRRYGIEVVAVIEEVPDVSPSPQYLSRLYKTVRETKPKAIFTDAQFSPRLARQIGADLKVPVAGLNTLETGPLKPQSYEEIMRNNLRVLQQALK